MMHDTWYAISLIKMKNGTYIKGIDTHGQWSAHLFILGFFFYTVYRRVTEILNFLPISNHLPMYTTQKNSHEQWVHIFFWEMILRLHIIYHNIRHIYINHTMLYYIWIGMSTSWTKTMYVLCSLDRNSTAYRF